MNRQEYSDPEISEIIKRAAAIDGQAQIDRHILERTASELGISQEALEQAEAEFRECKASDLEREQFIRSRKADFMSHLASYVCVNAFLVWLCLRGGGTWVIWPIMGWGIGIALNFVSSRQTAGTSFEVEFEAWRQRRSST